MTLDRRGLLATGLLMALGGCATPDHRVISAAAGSEASGLEAVKVKAEPSLLSVEAKSGGCSRKEDFTFYVERTDEMATIAFARKRLDPCEEPNATIVMYFTYWELGLEHEARIKVLNPVLRP